jgi:hypothetical protein
MFKTMWRRVIAAVLGVGAAAGVATAQHPPGEARVIHGVPSGVPGVYLVSGNPPPANLPAVAPPAVASPTVGVGVECSTGACPVPCATACEPEKQTCRNSGCWGGPYGFRDCIKKPATLVPPLGYSSRMMYDTQRMNALAEYFVVYREDWLKGTAVLNGSGERHVDGIARRLCTTHFPAKVEPTGDAALDAKRLSALIAALDKAGIADSASRVVLGGTRAEGLHGNEIESVYLRSPHSGGGYGNGGGFGAGYGGFGGSGGYGFR